MGSSVYLIFGEDEYAVSSKARAIAESLLPPDDRTLGLEVIDGAAETVEAAGQVMATCMEALETVGFMGGKKVVWLRDVSFLADNVVGRSETVKEGVARLEELVNRGLPRGTVFLVTAPKVDKRFAFFKVCKARAEIHEFAISEKAWQSEAQTKERVREILRETGLQMDEDALNVFLSRSGTDGRQMANEIEKLSLLVGKGKCVSVDDVRSLTSTSRSALAWDLADAFGKRELGGSLDVLRRLIFQKEQPIGLIILLQSRIRELMLYREALDKGWVWERQGSKGSGFGWSELPAEVDARFTQELNKDPRATHPFRVGVLAGQAKRFSQRELRRCQKAVVDAHREMVSSRVPPPIILELLLIRMLN